ncbi:MAG: cytochrome c family protein [Caulobacteraceae bacterium]|nr:cytochrome c family protein [Caulobacteraceae bacterium]
MRISPTLTVLMGAALVLGACGKKTEAPSAADQQTASAPEAAAPAGPTPEQVKTILASLPAPFNAGDIANGKAKFAQCAACHTITKGGPNMTGPNLYGVFGRKVGTAADFSYSDAVKAQGFTWDAEHINTWISGPMIMIPGTKMSFMGLKDPKDRADVIAYLKVSTTPAP